MYSPISFSFRLLGVDNRLARLKVGGNGPELCNGFFPFTHCFLSFIQCLLACVQFCFALSKLCFSCRILPLAGANHRKTDEQQEKKHPFHVRSEL